MTKKAAELEEAETPEAALPRATTERLVGVCVAGWLVPGLGHYMLGRKGRGLILFFAIVAMFLLGLAMQGEFYALGTGSYLETLGYFGVWGMGLARWFASFFGYAGGDPFFPSADYGTAFLISAGMLNVLTVFDVFDIAMGRKN
jgi:uncharacterized protein DUF6677